MSDIERRGASSSFTTIVTPSGTSPVATGPDDTLTLVAGAGITITGDASTDTITIAATGGSAWSLTGNSGTTAGTNFLGTTDSVALVVKTAATEAFRVTTDQLTGFNITAPLSTVHVAGKAISIPAPTSFGVSQVAEQSNTVPTDSIAITYGPNSSSEGNPLTATQNSGAGGSFFADGSTSITYYVYGVILFNGSYYYRPTAPTVGFNDDSSAQNFSVDLAWTTIPGATEYIIQAVGTANNGNPTWQNSVGNVTSFQDNGAQSGAVVPGSWDSIAYPYDAGGTAPTAPTGPVNQAIVDIGSGAKGPANGSVWSYQIDTAVQISGVWYTSGTPIASTPMSDNNNGEFYNWLVDGFTLNGGSETNIIVKRSNDGGSTFEYFFESLVTTLTDGSYLNDSTAAAAWGNTYSVPTTVTRQYRTYGYGTSPTNSTTWYSASFNSYTVVANNDLNGYTLLHSITQGSQGNTRLVGDYSAIGDYSQHKDTSATTLVEGLSNIWSVGAVVTPTHYGIQGTGQTRYWRFYSQKTSPSTYYSSSYLQGSSTLPNDSAYYTFNVSWVKGTGSNNTRILESTDGSSYTQGYLSGGTSIVRETSAPAFSGTLTITPNTLDSAAVIAQNACATATDEPQLIIKSTSVSTPVMSIHGRDSTDSSFWKIYNDPSTGALILWDTIGTHHFYGMTPGNIATIATTGAEFNKNFNTTYSFIINTVGGDKGFKFIGSSSAPKVYIGTNSSDNSASLSIVNTSDFRNLFLKINSGQSNDLITAVDAGGTAIFRVTSEGSIVTGTPGSIIGRISIQGGTASLPPIHFESGTLKSSAAAGAFEFLTDDFYYTQTTNTSRHPIASNNNPIGMQVFS